MTAFRITSVVVLVTLCGAQAGWAAEPAQADRFLLSPIGSERATSGFGNKIVTFGGKTHVVWQDSTQDGYFARIRTLDRKTGQWSPTYTIGQGRDNHARPTIVVDSKGTLHVIIGGHGSGLQYRHSVRPGDASEWTEIEMFGTSTYPQLICGPDDTLYLTGRHDVDWAGMDFYVKRPTEKWQHRGLLVRKTVGYLPEMYAAYHNGLAWGPDHKTLHMSNSFFMSPAKKRVDPDLSGLHQAVGYMRTEDFGKTWTQADGTPIELPATTESIDLIDEGIRDADATDKPKPGIAQCGMAVDSENRPYAVYIRHTPEPGRIILVTPDGSGGWQQRALQQAVREHWPSLGAIYGTISMTGDDVLCLALSLVPLDHPQANWAPGIQGRPAHWTRDFAEIRRIVWLESGDGGRTFTAKNIIPHDPQRGTLLPNIERPTGFNRIPAGSRPPLVYFAGLDRYRKKGELIQNDVYFVQPR